MASASSLGSLGSLRSQPLPPQTTRPGAHVTHHLGDRNHRAAHRAALSLTRTWCVYVHRFFSPRTHVRMSGETTALAANQPGTGATIGAHAGSGQSSGPPKLPRPAGLPLGPGGPGKPIPGWPTEPFSPERPGLPGVPGKPRSPAVRKTNGQREKNVSTFPPPQASR